MVPDLADDKQLLTVSSPSLLLNHIAQRYTRTSRIIMEYVDNSLDDAEALWRENLKTYSRPINILVEINRQKVEEASGDNAMVAGSKAEAQTDPTKSDNAGRTDTKKSQKDGKKKVPKSQENWITEVTVTDNCRGMDQETLNRLILNVGDSTKRGSKFTNGQFGFGVHAFRACAKSIEFKSKKSNAKTLGLKMDRDNEYFSKPKYARGENVKSSSGTIVKVSDFDNTWSEQLDPKEIIKEIQHHFSGLLERKNLVVEVRNVARNITKVCKPFKLKSSDVTKSIKKVWKFNDNSVKVRLFVAISARSGKNCMFVSKGRRINEICDVKSFMAMSRYRWAVWGHPNLLGSIDVSNVLLPVITRDEFRLTMMRKKVYRKIIEEVEPVLYNALHELNENRKIVALGKLEDVVGKCVNVALKKDMRRESEGMSYLQQMMLSKKPTRSKAIDEDFDVENPESKSQKRKRLDDEDVNAKPAGGENEKTKGELEDGKPKKKRKTGLGFNIAFVKDLANQSNGEPCRALLVGEDVQINMKHPDFLARIKINKNDHQPIVTERLCGYLANVIAAAYKSYKLEQQGAMEKYREDHSLLLDEILDVTLSLENQLRSKLKLMQREMETGAQAAAKNPLPTGTTN